MADQFKLPKLVPTATGILQQSLIGAVAASGGVADAGKVVLLDNTGQLDASMISGGGSTPFSGILSGTNTAAVMVVGSGASIAYLGTGVVNANKIGGINVSGNVPSHAGMIPISQP